MWSLGGGLFLGWSIGANDAANVFGTAVASRVIRFRTAALLTCAALMLGAWLQGADGLETIASITPAGIKAAGIASLAAALAVTLMTRLAVPVSATQAVVGAIIGVSLWTGGTDLRPLGKILLCWVATPLGALAISVAAYHLLGAILNRVRMSILTRDRLLWNALVVVGCYGAYALGANNVANVTGVYYGSGLVETSDVDLLNLLGSAAMALGALTYSRRVMMTVGAGLIKLDAYAALVAVLAEAVTVHIFAVIGVPVSTSQAVVGGVLGVALVRGGDLHAHVLRNIAAGWLATPVASAALGFAIYAVV